jgi:hypothetical protein
MKNFLIVIFWIAVAIFAIWVPTWIFEPLKPWGDFEVFVRLLSMGSAGVVGFVAAEYFGGRK